MKNRCMKSFSMIVLICCLLLSLMPLTAYANPNQEALVLEVPEGAIVLSTPEDVLTLAENCRVNTWSVGKTVVLANDIDMSETDFVGIPTFGGVFLGQGHKISGINLVEKGSVVGFFRYLQKNALVNGLSIEGLIQPKGSKLVVGAIAGNNAGIIANCSVNCLLSGYEKIGGVTGVNEANGVLINCAVTGVVYGSHFVGGIVGENHGVIRNCTNQANVNTQSVQNAVSIEDITIDSMINTESAYTTTDIGGIAGFSSGVIRGCVNKSAIGYQRMGYNIGGIVGTQNGYVVDCINLAEVQGRKEVGGIVGHMEPNIVVNFSQDSLQELSGQIEGLNNSLNGIKSSIDNSGEDINNQIDGLEDDVENVQNAIEVLQDSVVPGSSKWNDFDIDEMFGEDFRPEFDTETDIDTDRITAATNDLGDSLDKVYTESEKIQEKAEESAKDISDKLDGLMVQLEEMQATIDNIESGLNVELQDISDEDTDSDTIGKISNSINLGTVKGDMNVGGIAGIMAEENDFDDYSDTSVYGDESLNVSSKVRLVVRDCSNFGKISASKQYAGGIAGYMMMGAVLESINKGNVDALSADYVGGIAGSSAAFIRDCISKSVLAGDRCVGGIAGQGNEVSGCYAFVCIEAYSEKAGAVLGYTSKLPNGEEDVVTGNYYFIHGKNVGGIDGISYVGATDEVDLAGFLQLPNMKDVFRTVNVRMCVEGQEDIVLTVNVGESISLDALPTLTVEEGREYDWEYIPAVTSEIPAMGEIAKVEYLSEELLTNILFDQTYEAVYDSKNTVISASQRNDKNLVLALATGTFAKHTTLEISDVLSTESLIDGKELLVNWNVHISNEGVSKLHYLIPDDVDTSKLKLYVKNASGAWEEREFLIEGSYIIFDFADGEVGFALQKTAVGYLGYILIAISVVLIVLGIIKVRKRAIAK